MASNSDSHFTISDRICDELGVWRNKSYSNDYNHLYGVTIDPITKKGYIYLGFVSVKIYSFDVFGALDVQLILENENLESSVKMSAYNNYLFIGGSFSITINNINYNSLILYQINGNFFFFNF